MQTCSLFVYCTYIYMYIYIYIYISLSVALFVLFVDVPLSPVILLSLLPASTNACNDMCNTSMLTWNYGTTCDYTYIYAYLHMSWHT